jgi:hypothetical protein
LCRSAAFNKFLGVDPELVDDAMTAPLKFDLELITAP